MNEGPIFLEVIELGSEFEIGNSCFAFEMLPSRRIAMCGRYRRTTAQEELARRYHIPIRPQRMREAIIAIMWSGKTRPARGASPRATGSRAADITLVGRQAGSSVLCSLVLHQPCRRRPPVPTPSRVKGSGVSWASAQSC